MNEALNTLYRLQVVDSAIAKSTRQYHALDSGKSEQEALERALITHTEAAQVVQLVSRDLQDAELELKSVEEKKKKNEDKLYGGRVTNFKELEQLQAEVDALGRQRGSLDEKILLLMDKLEESKATEQTAKNALDASQAAVDAKTVEYKQAARVIVSRVKALQVEREQCVANVEPALLKRYDTVRAAKQGVAIAVLVGDDCGACHTNLPGNLLEEVRYSTGILTCENCGRILCVGDAAK